MISFNTSVPFILTPLVSSLQTTLVKGYHNYILTIGNAYS